MTYTEFGSIFICFLEVGGGKGGGGGGGSGVCVCVCVCVLGGFIRKQTHFCI